MACGDPLAKVDKLSSVELADDAVSVGALSDPADAAPQGLFSGLFGGRKEAAPATPSATDTAVGAALAEAQTELAPVADTPAPALAPEPQKRGLFGFMRAKETTQPATPVAEIVADAPIEAAVAVEPAKLDAITNDVPAAVEKPRKGLFGMLAGARAKDQSAAQEPQVRTASLGPMPTSEAAEKKK